MAVLSVDPAAEAILFVSRARGDSGTESDWDILILVDKDNVTWENEWKFRHKLYDIELSISQPISSISYCRSIIGIHLFYANLRYIRIKGSFRIKLVCVNFGYYLITEIGNEDIQIIPILSPLRKVNLTENRTLSEVEVSLLSGVCMLRLRSGSS